MKNSLLIAFLFVAVSSFAQSDLKFNSVVNFSVNQSFSYTVPAGKVLKIERTCSSSSNFAALTFFAGGGTYIADGVLFHSSGGQNWPSYNASQPIWVGAGQVVSHSGFSTSVSCSGILFDVIP